MPTAYTLNLRGADTVSLFQRDGKQPTYRHRYRVKLDAIIRVEQPIVGVCKNLDGEVRLVLAKIVAGPDVYTRYDHFLDCSPEQIQKLLRAQNVLIPRADPAAVKL